MYKKGRILIIGACGQIGRALTQALREKYGYRSVIPTDILEPKKALDIQGYQQLDVLDKARILYLSRKEKFTQVYHLAATLSAKGEEFPLVSWDLNMQGLLNLLDVAVKCNFEKVFWPSSIAVFGPDAPKENCPQDAPLNPDTVYGISKMAGEQWCKYYHEKYGLDVRSIRYPGLISHSAMPGGGTTDYAVDIFHEAMENLSYTCFLNADERLPMMYLPDAIRATLELMESPAEKITIRTSYNLQGISFSPEELAGEIKRLLPQFEIHYQPDKRQAIATSWPNSIEDSQARRDWGWDCHYDIRRLVRDMMENLYKKHKQLAAIPANS